jgi:hypothetical protein
MEPALDICIMAVPERMNHVKSYLAPRLRKLNADILVFEDSGKKGAWWNCKRIYQYKMGEGRNKLVIQDDLFLRDDFEIHVRNLMRHLSDDIQAISLFTPPRGSLPNAHKAGFNVLQTWKLVWPQMILVTDKWCQGVIRESRFMNDKERESKHDDTKMLHYAHASGNAPYIVTASLAQHDTSIKSAQGNPNKIGALERKSCTYLLPIPDNYYEMLNPKVEGSRLTQIPYAR